MRATTKHLMLGMAITLLASFGIRAAAAQEYPSRPITVIIPFAGGSASDVVARIMMNKMAARLGQPMIIDNRPGAGGNNGTLQGSKAEPDGYTLIGGGSGPVAANKTLFKELGYDPEKSLEIVSPFVKFTIVVTVSNKLPIKTVKELIDYAKAHPGQLNYGSVGIGSSQHLAGEYFQQLTGVKLTHVPYRNIAQYGPDLIAGSVQLGFQWYPNVAGPVGAKGATVIAVAGPNHLPVVPDAPTTTEAGLPQYQNEGWFALMAPKNTPRPILEKLNKALTEAIADPDVKEKFALQGAEGMAMPLDASKAFLSAEVKKYHDIIVAAGIQPIE
jgi:tripartite-type tricarboxylate transporter receptor subunit TctC